MILLTDKTTQAEYETASVQDAIAQAAYLISLGHEIKMEKGGN